MKEWIYQHKEHGLCLTFKAMIDCGVSDDTLSMASRRRTQSWGIIDHPEHGRKKLIVWSKLKDCYKEKVVRIIGDPYEYIAKQPIRELIEIDAKAEEYFRSKLLTMNVSNLNDYVNKYTKAASCLNMLMQAQKDKQFIRKTIGITYEVLINRTCEIIITDKISLPSSPRKLQAKVKLYKEESYASLIDWRFGNKLAAKIGKSEDGGFNEELKENQLALIRQAGSRHNNFDSAQITRALNKVFELKGWPPVSRSTVYNILKENEHLTIAGSRGKRVYENEISMHVKRSRPLLPLRYFTLDGWTVELGYIDHDRKVSRLVMVVVIDTMNNYPIGYAIGERENAELIRQANRNAIIHINELFGAPYRPRQIQSDRFAIKANALFFEAMAHVHTPAAVGNAKAKVIEPYFKYLNKMYCQPNYNWMGFNVDAKKGNQVNREFSDKIKGHFPNKAGLITQIEEFMLRERSSKKLEYLQAWHKLPESEKFVLSKIDLLTIFGLQLPYSYCITGQGITPTINGQSISYESFDPAFRALRHLNWKVVYDDYDLSEILIVSEDQKHRFVLEEKRIIPMDIHGMKQGDHEYLQRIRKFNADRKEEVIQQYNIDSDIVDQTLNSIAQIEPEDELALKGKFTYSGQQKETLQDAKGLKGSNKKLLPNGTQSNAPTQEQIDRNKAQMDYWNSKTNIRDYPDKPTIEDMLDQM